MTIDIFRVEFGQFEVSITIMLLLTTQNTYKINASKFKYDQKLLYNIQLIYSKMLSKAEKYRQRIQKVTQRILRFPHVDNQEKKSTVTFQCDITLPSLHPFRSSQQIQNNVPITHNITHQSSQKQYPTTLQNEWPKSCIGLILCEHHQNNQTFYVYGTGILIHSNIVLTSAQNVYCRRLNRQYTNIRFIVGVSDDKCSGIYDVKRVHYLKEYTMQKEYDNYNFAILQLYDDLSNSYGYVGLKTIVKMVVKESYTEYGYVSGNKEGSFKLRERTKKQQSQQDYEDYLGSGVFIKDNKNKYYIVGLQMSLKKERFIVLSQKMRNMINQWTQLTRINLLNNGVQECKYLSQANWTYLKYIELSSNKIGAQGCKYLSQANWIHLNTICLGSNNIGAQGCKYLSEANWIHLDKIDFNQNNIGAQGCKYLSEANWRHLTTIYLASNKFDAQGCKYLSQANWPHLNTIFLWTNNIGIQGCKYISEANWTHLNTINLTNTNICTEACKYLSQAKWIYLTKIFLCSNNIRVQGWKYLSQANWTHLASIELWYNYIGAQGCKYLSQANWIHLNTICLGNNQIDVQGCKYISQTTWKYLIKINLGNNKIDAKGCLYMSQANWTHLTAIGLSANNIDAQGCKYLSKAKWIHLANIQLGCNKIGRQGCKHLRQANWINLTRIDLQKNNIDAQGCKYLSQTSWTHLKQFNLLSNNIKGIAYELLLLQLYPSNTIKI